MKINCSCIGKRAKENIGISDLHQDIKNSLLNVRTCGNVSKFDAAKMVLKCQEESIFRSSAELRCVIPKLKGAGLDYTELTDLLLSMREEGALQMEVGTPLDMTRENEKDLIIDSGKNRFAYVALNREWAEKYMNLTI